MPTTPHRCAAGGLCLALLLPLAAYAQDRRDTMEHAADPFELADYQGKNRLLLVFAPSTKSPPYEEQRRLFEDTGRAFEERDLLLVRLLYEGASRAGERSIDASSELTLRQRFGVDPDDFVVVLVGKDGTEKRRDTAPVKPEAIFEEIDAMPMRQREMRERQ